MHKLILMTATFGFVAGSALANPVLMTEGQLDGTVAGEVNENADFVNAWHGVGDGHQAGNDPGDTAVDRHNFDDAAAGGSDEKPTGRNQGQ